MNTTTMNIDSLLDQVDLNGAAPKPSPAFTRGVSILAEGKTRSELDLAASRLAGFAPQQTIYARGTAVVQLGVDNFRASRVAFDKLPTVTEACTDFEKRIAGEERADVTVRAGELRMTSSGKYAAKPISKDGVAGEQVLYMATMPSVKDLASRAGFGGGHYLAHKCDPELRAINVNCQMVAIQAEEARAMAAAQAEMRERAGKRGAKPVELPKARHLKLRTRRSGRGREVFAVVTPSYTPFDVDKIARALRTAMPENARCTVDYDGERAKFNVVFHSDVQPEDAVCGEFFKAGITFRTDDTGGGSIIGWATVFQNLCLNLIVIDEAKSAEIRIRHQGSVEALAERFRDAMKKLQGQLAHFTKRWGYARKDDLAATARTEDGKTMREAGVAVEDVFPGLIRGLLEKEVLEIKGDHESIIDALLECHDQDESSAVTATKTSRAALANAITRYAHTVNNDPFAQDALQVAAGNILASNKPLVYVAKEVSAN